MIQEDVDQLFQQQIAEWEFVRQQYEALSRIRTRDVMIDESLYRIQFNPARALSSAARIDKASLAKRPCFLCDPQRPKEQKSIPFGEDYLILVNPYPIFPKHLTIPTRKHTDQCIRERFSDLLDAAKALPHYVLFYNGPKCGASAPDHAHFQAAEKGSMPLEKEWKALEFRAIRSKGEAKLCYLNRALNPVLRITSASKEDATTLFELVYDYLEIRKDEVEPRMNILTWYEEGKWMIFLFPRDSHRPSCYHDEEEYRRLISPGSVDMAGLIISAIERDFKGITDEELAQILREVSLPTQDYLQLIIKLKKHHD